MNGKEAYTVKTDDFGWFVVLKKETTPPTQPVAPSNPAPTIKSEVFHTSNNNEFPVVMKDEKTVDVEASKKILQDALDTGKITNDHDKKLAEDFIKNASDSDAEIIMIPKKNNNDEEQKKLFVKVNDHTTKVFHSEKNTNLKDSFKHTSATKGKPSNVDFNLARAPKWISDSDKEDITHYKDIGIGYTLLTKGGHWYYAPKKAEMFFTSKKTPFPVVLKDEKTVDFDATKNILVELKDKIANANDKLIAEEFIKNGTDKNVVILNIEDETLLFVQSDEKTTKVFHKSDKSHLLGKFGHKKDGVKEGTPTDLDLDKAIVPAWANKTEKITHYHETKAGYTLLNETGHWFYAPKKTTTSNTGNSGASTSGNGGGGYTSSIPVVTPTTPSNPTTEVKGDEIIRPTAPIFANFTKKCEQNVKNLSDPRLVDYYDVLKVENKTNLDRALTRAEFLKLLLNSANVDVSNESAPTYSDVPATHTLKNYIAYATRTNMISGQNGKFRPDDIITRAEAAKIFVNAAALGLSTEIKAFADVDTKHSLAAYIQTAYDNCLLHGRKTVDGNPITEPRVYEPNSAITLAETAKVLYNIVHQ